MGREARPSTAAMAEAEPAHGRSPGNLSRLAIYARPPLLMSGIRLNPAPLLPLPLPSAISMAITEEGARLAGEED